MVSVKENKELQVEQLRRVCDPGIFEFESTAELSVLEEMIGQERAVRATSFGIDIESPGYHMFALGPTGTGKTTMLKDLLERKSPDEPVPDDWCYINNDEGIEILTGVEAGEWDDEGNYPQGTVNYAVQSRLKELTEKVKSFSFSVNGEKE